MKTSSLYGNTDDFDEGEKLVLWYSSSNNSYLCKSVSSDGSKGAQFKGVDWKFVSKPVQWVEIETFYGFDDVFQLAASGKSTEEAIRAPLGRLTTRIFESTILYNGVPTAKDDTLEALLEAKKSVKADIYQTTVRVLLSFQLNFKTFFPDKTGATPSS